jgi:hypothetical protein
MVSMSLVNSPMTLHPFCPEGVGTGFETRHGERQFLSVAEEL